MTEPAARRRDRYGRNYYPIPDDQCVIHKLPSWTTLKNLLYSGGVETWKLKGVAQQIALRADLQLLAADESTTYEAVKQAEAAFKSKANTGTAIHKIVERVEAGTLDEDMVAAQAKPYLACYRQAVADHGLVTLESEVTVFNMAAGYAATVDKFATVRGESGVFAVDVKTGDKIWPEVALQLAAHANGDGIWTAPGDGDLPQYVEAKAKLEADIAAGVNPPPTAGGKPRTSWNKAAEDQAWSDLDELYWSLFAMWPGVRDMPEGIRRDVGFVLHLHADRCDLVPVRLDGIPDAFDVIVSLGQVFGWQARRDIVGEPKGCLNDANARVGADDRPSGGDGVPVVEVAPARTADESPTAVDTTPPDSPPSGAGHPTGADLKAARKTARATLEAPGSLVPAEYKRIWLRDRLKHLAGSEWAEALPEVAAHWPAGVPVLKHDTHTDEQLGQIISLLDRVEAEHEITFGPSLADYLPAHILDAVVSRVGQAFPGSGPATETTTDN